MKLSKMKKLKDLIHKNNLNNLRSFYSKSELKLPLYQQIKQRGLNMKDKVLIGLVGLSAMISLYYEFSNYSKDHLLLVKIKLENYDNTESSVNDLIEVLGDDIFTIIEPDHGTLLIEYEILDNLIKLLSHFDIKVRRKAVKKKKKN